MLYFSNAPVIPDSIDAKQYKKLMQFKKTCYDKGLVDTFNSIEDFRVKFTRHLTLKVNQHEYFHLNDITQDGIVNEIQQETNEIQLTEEEKKLIIEASNDPDGSVMKLAYIGGFDIQTNGKRLNIDYEPRTRALWQNVIDNLLRLDILEERGYKGEAFALTLFGYKTADKLKEK